MFVYSSNGMGYKKVIYYLLGTNWIKTVWINFFYFPFNQALHLPILVSYHTSLSLSGGRVELCGPISTGMLLLGYRQLGTQDSKGERTYWNVSGKVLISGTKNGIGRGCKIFISGQCIIGGWLCITGNSTIVCRKKLVLGIMF